MTRNHFRTWELRRASRARRLAGTPARIVFPLTLAWAMWFLSVLSTALGQWLVRTADFGR